MNSQEVLAELESLGTEQNRKLYPRHGIAEPMFGVSFANLGKMARRLKRDQPLAETLWATRNADAQQLAVMIADPAAFDLAKLQQWVESANSYATVDPLSKDIVVRTPHATDCVSRWLDAPSVIEQRAGWATIGNLAFGEPSLPDEYFLQWLPRIEANIHSAPNRIKEAMNSTLIAIGGRNDSLRGPATETAGRVGKVRVDHGETGCKTPDAAAYIDKMFARKAARASA
jgi:3-methyladenine DNA glycosylase AlkD